MRERYNTLPLAYVGHSFGGQALGLLANNTEVSRALLIAAQAGYWKLMASPERYRVYAMLNFVGAAPHPVLGYTPGWTGIGEDLPKGVFLQWARWVMSPRYLFDDPKLPALAEFSKIQGRAARAVHVRRSLGDAAGGRTAVLGLHLDQAGDPHRHAGRCRRRARSAISASSAPNIATRCGGVRRNGSSGND